MRLAGPVSRSCRRGGFVPVVYRFNLRTQQLFLMQSLRSTTRTCCLCRTAPVIGTAEVPDLVFSVVYPLLNANDAWILNAPFDFLRTSIHVVSIDLHEQNCCSDGRVATLLAGTLFSFVPPILHFRVAFNRARLAAQYAARVLGYTRFRARLCPRSLDDTQAVHDYILSRDALRELIRSRPLRTRTNDTTSISSTGSALGLQPEFESLHQILSAAISVDVDGIPRSPFFA